MSILLNSSKFPPRAMTPKPCFFFFLCFKIRHFFMKTHLFYCLWLSFFHWVHKTRTQSRATSHSQIPILSLLNYQLLMRRGGSLSSESRTHLFPDFILKSNQACLNPLLPSPGTPQLFISYRLSSTFSRWQFNINNWAIAFPPRERHVTGL